MAEWRRLGVDLGEQGPTVGHGVDVRCARAAEPVTTEAVSAQRVHGDKNHGRRRLGLSGKSDTARADAAEYPDEAGDNPATRGRDPLRGQSEQCRIRRPDAQSFDILTRRRHLPTRLDHSNPEEGSALKVSKVLVSFAGRAEKGRAE